MARCNNCSQLISYKEIMRSIWTGYKQIKCNECKSILYPTKGTRLRIAALIPVPLLVQRQLSEYFGAFSFLIFILWVALIFAISPVIATYNAKK